MINWLLNLLMPVTEHGKVTTEGLKWPSETLSNTTEGVDNPMTK